MQLDFNSQYELRHFSSKNYYPYLFYISISCQMFSYFFLIRHFRSNIWGKVEMVIITMLFHKLSNLRSCFIVNFCGKKDIYHKIWNCSLLGSRSYQQGCFNGLLLFKTQSVGSVLRHMLISSNQKTFQQSRWKRGRT